MQMLILRKMMTKRKKIIFILIIVAIIFLIYDYMYYTIDIDNKDEIVVIRMFEPFAGQVYVINDKDIIDEYLKNIDGKKLTNNRIASAAGKSYQICFYNKANEVVYEFNTLGGDGIIINLGLFECHYDGDIDAGVSMFYEHGMSFTQGN